MYMILLTAGLDYVQVSDTIQFVSGGPQRLCTSITILDDSLQEGLETFTLNLFSNDIPAGNLGPPATVSITDTVGEIKNAQ